MYEVALVDADQLHDTEAVFAVAVRVAGAAGTGFAPEELELLLDELDEEELDEEPLELPLLDELDEEAPEEDELLEELELLLEEDELLDGTDTCTTAFELVTVPT